MAKISIIKVVESCLAGIEKSFHEYLEWSGDQWLWNAPEYLLTVNIGKEIWKIEGAKYITLEDNVHETLKQANAQIKGRISQYARPNGRADIILWWAKGSPRAIIEVKHRVYKFENIREDLDRIIEILKKKSEMQFAISTFYISKAYMRANIYNKFEEKILNIFHETEEYFSYYANNLKVNLQYNIHKEDDKNIWGSVAILIKK